MKKLNRKGYMTVEIIIASVIAFSIAFFLMEITIKLVDINDNEYVNTNFMTDKALIMKNIKKNMLDDIKENGNVIDINCFTNYCSIIFENSWDSSSGRRIVFEDEDNIIKYTEDDNNGNVIYSKELDSSLSNISLNGSISGDYVYFQIKGDNIFSDEDYDINIVVYNG